MTDASELPFGRERLDGLATSLRAELVGNGVDVDDPTASATATAIARWAYARASALTSVDVVEAISSVQLLDHSVPLGHIDSALSAPA